MSSIDLDYSSVTQIIKDKLKIQNTVKSIKTTFLNTRYFEKINYKPYFQREYVWDVEKSSYFIESILLGTEIPPIVLFQTEIKNEVIDGRQRCETIERFLNDKLTLKEIGLKSLKSLDGKKYSTITPEQRTIFEDTKLRILQCSVVNEPDLEPDDEDKIKKQIFKRYNSGITSLSKEEIDRAAYINDNVSLALLDLFSNDKEIYKKACLLYLPKKGLKKPERDRINILVSRVRTLITLPYIPLYSYAQKSSKPDIIKHFYRLFVFEQDTNEVLNIFKTITDELYSLYNNFDSNFEYKTEKLIYEVFFWVYYSLRESTSWGQVKDKGRQLALLIQEGNNERLWIEISEESKNVEQIFQATGSHYYSSIINRYQFAKNTAETLMGTSVRWNFKNPESFKSDMGKVVNSNKEMTHYKLNKAIPESIQINDIIDDMKKNRFLIRPSYQRSEVTDIRKASYLMESIILGIQIPPIYIYKRKDGIKEVIDGQQRILTILGFLGEAYKDEKGQEIYSEKNKFKITELKILSELKSDNVDTIEEKYLDKILDFPIDVIEIDAIQNENFNQIDLFLRLNTKPYPIKENTFEMWNAYIDKEIVLAIKKIANDYADIVFRKSDSRMKLEELITILAYFDYKMSKPNSSILDCISIYSRNERINARVMNKNSVTKLLADLSNSNSNKFLNSIKNVESFAKKVLQLSEVVTLQYIFAHKEKNVSFKTDQNFYLLWAMLSNISLEELSGNEQIVGNKLNRLFAESQNISDSEKVETFIDKIQNVHNTGA